jgi:hypothetical protein
MTMIIVLILGAGALLLISAIENCPIASTFQGIIAGKPIDSLCK